MNVTRTPNIRQILKTGAILFFLSTSLSPSYSYAQRRQEIMEEKDVPPYTLPDPLVFNTGNPVKSKKQWKKRREEILTMAKREMYGQSPEKPKGLHFKVFDEDPNALGGIATRKQITISLSEKPDAPKFDLLIYYPNKIKGPAPVFLGLNFEGNHAINTDPGIRLSKTWVWAGAKGAKDSKPTEASRGATASRWHIERLLDRGYAVATVFANEIALDKKGPLNTGVLAAYPELQDRGDNFSTIGAWAWGLSRAMDYLETDPKANKKQVMVFGFSRMGKASLWAGAQDQRFAVTISNESGGGGAALSKRIFGEDVARLTNGNPHWFATNFKKYNQNEEALPFDQHMIVSLIAPRAVYIASAEQDKGADPYGEFLTAQAADPVYRFLGVKGFPATHYPALHEPILGGHIAYHVRAGNHDVTDYDWDQYMNFADRYFKQKP